MLRLSVLVKRKIEKLDVLRRFGLSCYTTRCTVRAETLTVWYSWYYTTKFIVKPLALYTLVSVYKLVALPAYLPSILEC